MTLVRTFCLLFCVVSVVEFSCFEEGIREDSEMSVINSYCFIPPCCPSLSSPLCLPSWLQQASECLQEHTVKIRSENQRLRSELKQVIDTTNDLQLQKKRLTRQYHSLLREHQLNCDLQRLHSGVYGGRGGDKGRGSGTLPNILTPLSSSRLRE